VSSKLLSVLAGTAVFTVMFTLGLGVAARELSWGARHPGLIARALFSVLVAVPVVAVVVGRALGLPRSAQIGLVLMAIAPGAPVALRRSLDAGGHAAFAPALQMLLAGLAVASMPVSIAILDDLYAGHASLPPADVARQVFVAQLLPLGLGMLVRHFAPLPAARLEPWTRRLSNVLLVALLMAIVLMWRDVIGAGSRALAAIVITTVAAMSIGHALGGPEPGTRTAVAVSSAARNPGLALLVTTVNNAPPEIGRMVLAYLVVSALTVLPYAIWRRRVAAESRAASTESR
jgi:BASS family bile acid:Na+ symporter